MRIAQVSPLYERVPPRRYGGTERVVAHLCDELVRRGHAVTLFASGDSCTQAELVAVTPRALRLDPETRDPIAAHVLALARVFERAADFDVTTVTSITSRSPIRGSCEHRLCIPCTAGWTCRACRRCSGTSTAFRWCRSATPSAGRSTGSAFAGPPPSTTACRSRSIRTRPPAGPISRSSAASPPRSDRTSPSRSPGGPGCRSRSPPKWMPSTATTSTARSRPSRSPADRVHWRDRPGRDASFLGGARALLFPIDWPEPFGLAMIEAMACGTPVIARACGSVPEVIVPGRTGLIGDTLDELVAAVERVDTISRAACRRYAEEWFTVERMALDYEAVYRRLLVRASAA